MNNHHTTLAGFDDPLRQLYLLAVEPDLSLDDKVAKLLALGTETLELDLGIVSRVERPIYECLYVHGPEWAPAPGTTFDVTNTYCLHTLGNGAVTAFYHAGQEAISAHPCYENFGLESYIGAPLMRGDAPFGTLSFSSTTPRAAPFSEAQSEFVEFLARWLSNELKLHAERRELREQRGLLAAMIDAVPEAMIMTNSNRQLQMVNPAAETLFGYDQEQLLGRQTAVLYESLDRYEKAGKERYNAEQAQKQEDVSTYCRRHDGSTFEGLVSSAPIKTDRGEHLGFLGIIRDVTEQRAFERAKDQLIATVSHEMKTPLTSLQGALKLLEAGQDDLPAPKRKLLRVALRNARAIEQMVADILDVEQLRTQDQSGFDEQPLSPLLTQAAETLAPYAKEHNVELSVEVSQAPGPLLHLHDGRVMRLVSNLLSNAIKASTEGATVRVGMARSGMGFWIKDEGAGLPLDLQPVLFERFSRGASYQVEEGHGLGMSIVKAIVDQHLGDISFDTAEGEGTTFYVDFPLPETQAKVRAAS
ncbi:ATP-binding protein [Sulfitobacter delicatus]|uniref:histidine kinase n=1 Tax=Sulfitobacter delicatus TaxID=218672 RepID=A0A1G7VHI3_9RHOB|nr:ATP-binding protein [Sulfitobacter delicatus]SDG59018.1 PAS domain S-box-containing protein [Sulfitobacter delicatus]